MDRRQFLMGTVQATLALAGCNAGDDGPVRTGPEETPWPTAIRSRCGHGGRTWITAEHTARIPVTLTNHASHVRTFYDHDEPEVKRGFFDNEEATLAPFRFTDPPDCIGTDGRRPGPFGESAEGPAETELRPASRSL